MIFISVTRLRIRRFYYLPSFILANEASVKQLLNTPGFLSGKELVDKNLTFWTMTFWKDLESMKLFRNSNAHRKAMRKLPVWCNEASYVHWEEETILGIDWQVAFERMMTEGKATKVKNPSKQQLAYNYPSPKWGKTDRILLAKS